MESFTLEIILQEVIAIRKFLMPPPNRLGKKHRPESIEKMKGNKNRVGKKHSPESIEKMKATLALARQRKKDAEGNI